MKKLTTHTLRSASLATLIAALTACGGGSSGGGSQPTASCTTISIGDQTVACTDGSCSLLQLQWTANNPIASSVSYTINSSPAAKAGSISISSGTTTGYVYDLNGSTPPLALGASSKSYTVTFSGNKVCEASKKPIELHQAT